MIDDINKDALDEAKELAAIVTEAQIGVDILRKVEEQAKGLLETIDTSRTVTNPAVDQTEEVEQMTTAVTDIQTSVAAAQADARAEMASQMTTEPADLLKDTQQSINADTISSSNANTNTNTSADPIASLVSNGN